MSGERAESTKAYCLKPGEGEVIAFVGERARVLADSTTTGGRCFIFEETTPAGGGPPLHRHGRDDEFFFILEGRFKFVMDGREFLAEPGAFVSAPKGTVHAFVCTGPGPGRMLIMAMPAGLEGPFRAMQEREKAGPVTPEALGPIFAAFDLAFVGPPLRP